MANVSIVNELIPAPNRADDLYFVWRIHQEMQNAGWVVVASSDGTTMTTGGAGWLAFTDSDNVNSWVALARAGNTGHGISFNIRPGAGAGGIANGRLIGYTISGWNMAGANATTPPVAIGTTYYLSGTLGGGGYSYTGPSKSCTITYVNFQLTDSDDDHSIWCWGYANASAVSQGHAAYWVAGALTNVFGFTRILAPDNVGDPYMWFVPPYDGWYPQTTYVPRVFDKRNTRAIGPAASGSLMTEHFAYLAYKLEAASALLTSEDKTDQYVSATTRYGEHVLYAETGTNSVKGYPRHIIQGRGSDSATGTFYNTKAYFLQIEAASSANLVFPWDGSTATVLRTGGEGAGADQTMTFLNSLSATVVPPVVPTITVTPPAANPCDPQDPVTIDYEYTGAGGTAVCVLKVTAWGDDGIGTLIYEGLPASPGTLPYPTDEYVIDSSSDDGTTGQLVISPATGVYWPIDVCTWTATITSDVNTEGTHSDSQTVDASLIPVVPPPDVTDPVVSGQSPSPGSVINANTAISFNVTDNIELRTVFVFVAFAGTDAREVVHDGTSFTPNYAGASTRTGTSANYTYTVRRFGGWPASPTFTALPIDTSGNQP